MYVPQATDPRRCGHRVRDQFDAKGSGQPAISNEVAELPAEARGPAVGRMADHGRPGREGLGRRRADGNDQPRPRQADDPHQPELSPLRSTADGARLLRGRPSTVGWNRTAFQRSVLDSNPSSARTPCAIVAEGSRASPLCSRRDPPTPSPSLPSEACRASNGVLGAAPGPEAPEPKERELLRDDPPQAERH